MTEHPARWWIGTLITVAGVVIAVLAWQLPKDPSPRPSPQPGQTSPIQARPATHDVPNALIGGWQGVAGSPSGNFAVQLNLQQGGVGECVGSFLIPAAGCRSDVVLESAESAAINAKIEVKSGACVSGNARFSLQPGGLRYQAMASDGQPVAGNLQRL